MAFLQKLCSNWKVDDLILDWLVIPQLSQSFKEWIIDMRL